MDGRADEREDKICQGNGQQLPFRVCLSSCSPVASHKGLEGETLLFGVQGGAGSQAAFGKTLVNPTPR